MKHYEELPDVEGAINFLIEKTGFPSFEEFAKNPDKWRNKHEALFEAIDASTQIKRERLIKQIYLWKDQYQCDSLEKLQRIMAEEGYTEEQCDMIPRLRLVHGTTENHEVESIVQVWPKEDIKAKGGIVANA